MAEYIDREEVINLLWLLADESWMEVLKMRLINPYASLLGLVLLAVLVVAYG